MPEVKQLAPQEAIETISALATRLSGLADKVRGETVSIHSQWRCLVRAGGKCDEYAIRLLRNILPSLDALESFCTRAAKQIRDMREEPEEWTPQEILEREA